MLTQCPSCSTLFRVTATILKMGHGQVRCGKCRTQFDALESIQDEDAAHAAITPKESVSNEEPTFEQSAAVEPTEAPNSTESAASSNDNAEAEFEDAIEIELSPDGELDDIGSGSMIVVESEQPSIDADAFVEQMSEEEFDIRQLSDQTPTSSDITDDLESDVSNFDESTEAPLDIEQVPTEGATRTKRPHWLRRSIAVNGGDHLIAAELAALTTDKAKFAPRTRMFAIASVVLVLIGIAQVIHHHRDDLVRNASIGSTVTRVYHALGLTLTPRWDLAAYELQQWGVISDPKSPDTLRVRASVTNRAQFSQPYPLIRLELQDRWGAPVAMRVFGSEDYLPDKNNANRLLSPKQRANAEIVIADPGADAIGFQIHACLQYQQGLSCSDE